MEEINKYKRLKSEQIKNTMSTYLQKRNYPSVVIQNISQQQQITNSLIENEVCRPNSILFSCYKNEPELIETNFNKFILWLKELIQNKNTCQGLELLIGPLFCHLYYDILKSGHSERAKTFFKSHLLNVNRNKCDQTILDLINIIASNDNNNISLIERFRSNKYLLELTSESIKLLKIFITENGLIVILHTLQTWFDLKEIDNKINSIDEQQNERNGKHTINHTTTDNKLKEIMEIINELKKEPKEIFQMDITNTKEPVNCALIKRSCGLVVYNQINVIHLRPIHSYDPILGYHEFKEIKFTNHKKPIYSFAISPNSCYLSSASSDHDLCIYNLITTELVKTCIGHLGPVYCTAISSNNMYVASGSFDTTARLWDLTNGKLLRVFAGHTRPITCIDFHPNCLYLATGSSDYNIRLWNLENANPLRLFHGANGTIYSIAFNPLGEHLASASDDEIVRIWDLLQSKIFVELKYKGNVITKLIWSDDGKKLCAGSIDGIIRMWDFENIRNNLNEVHEPIESISVNKKLLNFEFSFDTFACVTT